MKNYILIATVLSVWPLTVLGLDSFSYSGRLVNNNGSPVAGPVTLRFDLSSTVPLAGTLCTKTVTGVQLSQGVFHVKLKFDPADCGGDAFEDVMESIPANQNMTYQVTDVTNSRTYAVQNMYAVPSSFMANFAKNLPQMGALPNQVLKWDDGLKRWVPGSAGSGDGTVKSITTDSSLTGGPITDTGTLAVAVGGITNSHLAGGIDPAKLAGTRNGTTYLKGDNTWSIFGTDVLGTLLTGFSAASTSIVAATDSILAAFGKLQGQVTDLENNKLSKTGGTLSVGTINGVPTPLFNDQVANKKYVDDQIGGVNSSQWLDAAPHIYFNAGNVGVGTGTPAEKIDVVGNIALTGRLRLKDSGSNYVELRAPITTAGVTFVLPASVGTNGQVLKTDGTGNLSWGNSSVGSSDITDGSIVDADVAAGAAIAQSKIADLTTDLAAKQNLITAGTTAQYWRGDKTWQTLNTDVVPEGTTNKYYSNTLARGAISADSPISYNSGTGVIGMVAGTTGDLLRYNGTNWVPWAPNYLTAEADTLATVTGRGATTTTAVTLNGGANFPNNGIWNASGSVGIGINAPTSLLDVTNTSNTVANYLMRLRSNTTNGVNTDTNVLINFAESNGSNVQDWVLGTGSNTFFGHPDNFGLRTKTYSWNAFVVNPAGGGRVYLTPAGGRVGIGTTTARSTLEVAGGIQIGNDAAACDATKVGTLRYTSGNVEYCNGTAWAAFGVSGSGITNFNGSSVGSHSFATPGTTGTAPNWVTVPATGVHTLHVPLANAAGVTAGLISKTDYDAFSAKLGTSTSLSGDVTGTYNATSVDRIKGTPVTITTLTSGNLLRYNGAAWVNALLGATDIPNLDAGKITTGLLPVSRGGTNNGTLAGDRIMVSTGTSIVEAPALTNGQLLIGSTGNTPVASTLTAGTGVTITNSAGGITISASGAGGTVTNVTGTAPISVATGTSTPVVSISQATTSTNGYLSSTDWNTFNNKQSPLSAGPTINGVNYPASGAQNLQVTNAPVNLTDVVNLQALNTAIGGIPATVWSTSGSNIFNNNTGNVGIGTNTPGEKLDVNGVIRSNYKMEVSRDGNSGLILVNSYRDATNHSKIQLRGARGTQASGAHLQNNDIMGEFRADAWTNGSTWSDSGMIQVRADEAHSATSSAGRMEFFVTPSASLSFSATPNMVIKSSGDVGIGTSTPGAKLDVVGQIKISGGSPGAGKVLTSDAAGLASWATIAPGGVTSVTGTAPVTVTGTTTPVVSMAAATSSANGYLTSTDWTTFNSKLGTATSFSGDVTGTYNATSVDRIKGTAVTITSLTSGNFLRYNGSAWVNAMLGATDIPNLDAVKITTGVLPVARGGTNLSSLSGNRVMLSNAGATALVEAPAMTNGQLLIGSTGNAPVASNLTAGTGISISNSAGGITINATGGGADNLGNHTATQNILLGSNWLSGDGGNEGVFVAADGRVGVGTNAPLYPFHVSNDGVNLSGTTYVLAELKANTSIVGNGGVWFGYDSSGNTGVIGPTYALTNVGLSFYTFNGGQGERVRITPNGNMGIGTVTPGAKLEVAGQVKITGGTPGAGKVLTSDASGLATWTTPAGGTGDFMKDGSVDMTGQFKAIDGSSTSPSITFAADTGTGFFRVGNYAIGLRTTSHGNLWSMGNTIISTQFGGAGISRTAGTESAPAFLFQGDANTGMFSPTTDVLAFTTNGLEKLRITSAGNVGIGTTTPGAKLDVAGQIKISGGTPGAGKVLTSDASGLATWQTATGGTPAGSDMQVQFNTGGAFDSDANFTFDQVSTAMVLGTAMAYNSGSLVLSPQSQTGSSIVLSNSMMGPNATSDGLVIETSMEEAKITLKEMGNLTFGTDSTERMRVSYNGDVGIGTSSPSAKLEVAGQVKITGGAPGAGKVLTSDADGLATWELAAGMSGSGTTNYIPKFTASGTIGNSSILEDASSRVGIGGNPTNYRLEVFNNLNNLHGIWVKNNSNGTSAGSQIALSIGATNSVGGNLAVNSSAVNADLANRLSLFTQPTTVTGISIAARNAGQDVRFYTGGTFEKMRLDASGNLLIGTTTANSILTVAGVITPSVDNTHTLGNGTYRWSAVHATNGTIQTSDKRLKKDISELALDENFISSLNPVQYRWKDENGDKKVHFGFIAQDIDKKLKDQKVGNNGIVNYDNIADRFGVNYSELIAPIVKTIQGLFKRLKVEEEKSQKVAQEQADLRKEIERLKEENAEMKTMMKEIMRKPSGTK